MDDSKYKYNYPEQDQHYYNPDERQQKANKILAVLRDFYRDDLSSLSEMKLLDIGSSTGIITNLLGQYFKQTVGIDIDGEMVNYARANFENERLHFYCQDSMSLQFDDNTFDVVNCAHVYEYIPDVQMSMNEIYRVLKPGGICYFAAGNRLILVEPHHHLPLLSVIPKPMAHKYLRLFGKHDFYYETMLTYWQLKKMVKNFERFDYTKKIIQDPLKFHAMEMIRPGSLTRIVFLGILGIAFWLSPTYIWILKKGDHRNGKINPNTTYR